MCGFEKLNRELMAKSRLKNNKGLYTFIEFINANYIPNKSEKEIIEIKENIKALERLDKEEEIILKTRMHQLVEDYDPSKFFPTAILILGMIISAYKLISEIFPDSNFIKGVLLIISLTIPLYIMISFKNFIGIRNTVIYFNHLVNEIEYNVKNELLNNTDDINEKGHI
ncbi:hypothetical protein U1P98_23235 [Lysinibacillus irui]|uniref:Uncharacterized protein n=1 Tax=Lysinibacillus irui TaxID=2998077 RepID=A0ABU5NT05_9BACI|nr:hypothetical protein [Lysinibacillus irui]MEA0556471.1 hypothetical protein [Lysinibacillus irui]MEA0979198.1 hypothetical protein [Lysinibacillus irui]MEA1045352.1 hypothetical protein [Lysinibacillus irui]